MKHKAQRPDLKIKTAVPLYKESIVWYSKIVGKICILCMKACSKNGQYAFCKASTAQARALGAAIFWKDRR